MVAFRFNHVRIDSYSTFFPENIVSSSEIEDKISDVYKKFEIPFGTLERLSGVKNRRMWGRNIAPSDGGSEVVKNLLEKISFDRYEIGALLSCSVCRDLFEPATACIIHNKLGLNEQILSFDITNACIGFTNGLMTVGSMIETGIIKAAIVVSAENPSIIIDSQMNHLAKKINTLTRSDLIKLLPTFTLGCGAVAFAVCHESISPNGHKLIGGVGLTNSENGDLCLGNGDFCLMDKNAVQTPLMETESSTLINAASKLGGRAWKEAEKILNWTNEEIDHIFCHQVGKQVNQQFYKEMGLDIKKEYTNYKNFGNMISAAMPSALVMGAKEKNIQKGAKVLTTAFGSGLNSIFLGIEW